MTKTRACTSTRRRTAGESSALRSATDMPVMNERYDGKRGSTQGERNENNPALNATATPSDCPTCYLVSPSTSEWAASLSQGRGPSASPVILPSRSTMKLVGRARTPYVLATSIFESSAIGNVNLCWAMKGGTTLGLESSETATMTNPCPS